MEVVGVQEGGSSWQGNRQEEGLLGEHRGKPVGELWVALLQLYFPWDR